MASTCGDFGKAFTQNMSALGLPAPTSLFGSVQAAASNVATMLGALKTLGPSGHRRVERIVLRRRMYRLAGRCSEHRHDMH
jgi:hypothetical protein